MNGDFNGKIVYGMVIGKSSNLMVNLQATPGLKLGTFNGEDLSAGYMGVILGAPKPIFVGDQPPTCKALAILLHPNNHAISTLPLLSTQMETLVKCIEYFHLRSKQRMVVRFVGYHPVCELVKMAHIGFESFALDFLMMFLSKPPRNHIFPHKMGLFSHIFP